MENFVNISLLIQKKGHYMENNNNNDNNSNNKGSIFPIIICIIIALCLFGSCSSDDSKYKNTLNDGLKKYYNGEKMDKDEYDAVKGFKNWQDKQSEKSYDDWDN